MPKDFKYLVATLALIVLICLGAVYFKKSTKIVHGDYVKLTILDCKELNKYPEKYTSGLEKLDLSLISCGEAFPQFYLKYSSIKYKQVMYRVNWVPADKDLANAKIKEYNVPYCVVGALDKHISVQEECSRIP